MATRAEPSLAEPGRGRLVPARRGRGSLKVAGPPRRLLKGDGRERAGSAPPNRAELWVHRGDPRAEPCVQHGDPHGSTVHAPPDNLGTPPRAGWCMHPQAEWGPPVQALLSQHGALPTALQCVPPQQRGYPPTAVRCMHPQAGRVPAQGSTVTPRSGGILMHKALPAAVLELPLQSTVSSGRIRVPHRHCNLGVPHGLCGFGVPHGHCG